MTAYEIPAGKYLLEAMESEEQGVEGVVVSIPEECFVSPQILTNYYLSIAADCSFPRNVSIVDYLSHRIESAKKLSYRNYEGKRTQSYFLLSKHKI